MEYQSENKICQNCKKDFIIEPDDFLFYEKIKVPAPTFCPECRMIRRVSWRNTRSLYKRSCGLCQKLIISMYPDTNLTPVYCEECWTNGDWNPLSYGEKCDFSQNFFSQLIKLWNIVPRFYTFKTGTLINSDYTNYSKDNKNVYLSYSVSSSEGIMYSENVDFTKNSLDNLFVNKLDNCSYNINTVGNYNTHYAVQSNNCIDSHFIFDCINCQDCFMSYNLRNKKYYFKNQQLSKEEYKEKIKEFKLETFSGFNKMITEFNKIIQTEAIHRYASIYHSKNVEGDNINNSKNIKYSFNVYDSEDDSYCVRLLGTKDCYDCQGSGFGSELIYESIAATLKGFDVHFCYICLGCRECEYSGLLRNCQNCFGCFGLKNSSFCILNKQYKKEDYFKIIEKIKKHMMDVPYIDNKGRVYRYGEFFPFEMSPFGYNESDGNAFFFSSREESIKNGYNWKEREKRDYDITIQSVELPDSILDVNEDILSEIISCPNNGDQKYQCTVAYRIMPEELQFYKKKMLPIPRYCPNCRHYQRLKYSNPMKLWHRGCMKEGCTNEFETSYSPERPEIVYCEKCYQGEVY